MRVCKIGIGALILLGILAGDSRGVFAQQQPAATDSTASDKQLSSIAGSVLSAGTNEPLRKARIVLRNEQVHSADPYLTVTDGEGKFSITGILPGRYHLQADRSGYLSSWHGEDASGKSVQVLDLGPGQQVTGLVFRLQRYGVITGCVFDEYGDPAEGVQVEAAVRETSHGHVRTWHGGRAVTNDLGEYRLFGLEPGRYFVHASPQHGGGQVIGKILIETYILSSAGGYVPTYYPGVSDISRASAIEVKGSDEISGIDLVLIQGGSYKIRGGIVNAVTGLANGEGMVWLVPKDTEASSEDVRTGEVNGKTGEFEIDDVPNGSYTIRVTYGDIENRYEGSASVEVMNGDVNSVRIVITRGAEIHGRITREGKVAATSRLTVIVSSKDRSSVSGGHSAQVAADGTFTIGGVPDGLFEIEVASDCDVCYLKSASANGTELLDSGLQVSSGSAPSPIDLVYSSNSASVDGTVVKADGSPSVGAMVVVVPDPPRRDQGQLYARATTDQYGHFLAKRIAPGKFHAFAWEKVEFSDTMDSEFLATLEQKAQAISIGEGEKKSVQLTVIPATGDDE
jgi:hypothetical protein